MADEIKVSIVIPVYNAEKYLRECLDSLVNQTLPEIEIICVNDGSKDNSAKILDEYAQKDSRVKVFHQQNQGASVAYNNGMKHVQGEYLFFVDADDYIRKDSLELLYNTSKERNCDMLLHGYYHFAEYFCSENQSIYKLISKLGNRNVKFEDYCKYFINASLATCGKFYKTSLIKENDISFPIDIASGEDRFFAIKAYINANSISVLKEFLYYYRSNSYNSLTKIPLRSLVDIYKVDMMIKDIIYSSKKIQNKNKVYREFLYSSQNAILIKWNSIYNFSIRKVCYKYLKLLLKEYKPFLKDSDLDLEKYNKLKEEINKYRIFFVKKLIEPILEFELRGNRIAVYLFEKQVLNFYIDYIKNDIFRLQYILRLIKLRFKAKKRKIKVAFWYYEIEKWSSIVSLYKELEKSEHFEPVIYLSGNCDSFKHMSQKDLLEQNCKFLDSQDIKYKVLYDKEENKFLPIENYKCDIIFYQLPWAIATEQNLNQTAKFALTCYVPYCFYSLKSNTNYFTWFHGKLWKYFVETDFHKKEYAKEFKAKNCVALGSVKFDNYKLVDKSTAQKHWKTNKKRIIYAPHHSIEASGFHNMATFIENGDFILELAKKYKDKVEWIFRPHFALKDRLLRYGIRTEAEIDEYYRQWEELGKISKSEDNYYEQFITSDGLITDCISFLSEYLPVNKPVLHLRNKKQAQPFNDLLQNIIDGYYQIYEKEEIEKIFKEVIINGNDYLRDKRSEKVKYLMIDENKTTAQKIREYLETELRVK